MKTVLRAAIIFGMLASGPASANPLKSLYTTIELEACQRLVNRPNGGAWLCPGLKAYPVYIAEDALRTYVSVGAEPEKRVAAKQTLPVANSLFRGQSRRATIEWRFVRRNGQVVPFATIQRYFTKAGATNGEVLVVTKVTPTEDCHVAHVDALENPDAIALARSIADREARSFNCAAGPKTVVRPAGKAKP